MRVLLSCLIWLIIGLICSKTASKKGRNPSIWFFLGMFLGIIAFIILYLLPAKKLNLKENTNLSKMQNDSYNTTSTQQAPTPASTHVELWYYLDNQNNQFGPMSFEALEKAWNCEKIHASTYVWNRKLDKWLLVEEVPILKEKWLEHHSISS